MDRVEAEREMRMEIESVMMRVTTVIDAIAMVAGAVAVGAVMSSCSID